MAANSAIRIVGLKQCCILTIQKDTATKDEEGKLIKCPFCLANLRYRDGAFEWSNLPYSNPAAPEE